MDEEEFQAALEEAYSLMDAEKGTPEMKRLLELVGLIEAYEANIDKLDYPDRWQHCSSTHCERRGECTSPHDCCAAVNVVG